MFFIDERCHRAERQEMSMVGMYRTNAAPSCPAYMAYLYVHVIYAAPPPPAVKCAAPGVVGGAGSGRAAVGWGSVGVRVHVGRVAKVTGKRSLSRPRTDVKEPKRVK